MGPEPDQSDRKSYIPRDMVLSLLQATQEEHLWQRHSEQLRSTSQPQPMASHSVEPFSEGQGIDAGFVLGFLKAFPGQEQAHERRQEGDGLVVGHRGGHRPFRARSAAPRGTPLRGGGRPHPAPDKGLGDVLGLLDEQMAVTARRSGKQGQVGDGELAGDVLPVSQAVLEHATDLPNQDLYDDKWV